MAGLIPQIFLDDLLARVPIAEIISSRIQLKKSGATLTACCPFHQEKTPSFHVNTQKNFYHCFGCGVNGNAITFLREHDNLSFVEAVEELAKVGGMEVPRDERVQEVYSEQKRLLESLEYASLRYREALQSHASKSIAQDYLVKRKLTDEIVERFAIGFAPPQRDFLSAEAATNTRQSLIKTKMVSEKYQRPFDLFQNRLMFPIRNPRGKTIAFGGRTLGDDKAKYINGYDSDVYKKSNVLFGLYECLQANKGKRLEHICVVEGYIDVLAGFEMGYSNVVSCCGTNLTSEQITLLFKYTDEIVIIMDGDKAGNEGLEKGIINALPCIDLDKTVRYLVMDEGDDLANMLEQGRQNSFATKLELTFGFEDWMVSKLRSIKSRNKFKQMCLQRKQVEDWFAKMECEHLTDVLKTYLRSEMSKRNG